MTAARAWRQGAWGGLYPDALLAQVLMASTYPLEVVEAARWSRDNPNVKGEAVADAVQTQTWDPSVKSLAVFRDVRAVPDRQSTEHGHAEARYDRPKTERWEQCASRNREQLPALVRAGHIAQEQLNIGLIAEPLALPPCRIRSGALLHSDQILLADDHDAGSGNVDALRPLDHRVEVPIECELHRLAGGMAKVHAVFELARFP